MSFIIYPSAYGTSPKTGEEYAVGLPTEGREVLHATIAQKVALWE